jgi:hypothetical protein
MRDLLNPRRGALTAAAVILAVVPFVALRAQQPPAQQPPAQQPPATQAPAGQQPPAAGQPGAPGQTPPPPPSKPMTPVTVSTLVAQGERYIDDTLTVTVTGPVEQSLSPLSFSMDPDPKQATGKDLLVLAPRLNAPVTPNGYVTVIGKVVKFSPDLAKTVTDRKIDVPADVAAKFNGKPVMLATTVITSDFKELTRRIAPPMTAEEKALQPLMQRNQQAIGAARTAANEADMPTVRQNALILKQNFTQIEKLFKDKGLTEPMTMAANSRTKAEELEKSVATGKWDDVKAATAAVQQTCQQCHAAHRERFDDGGFRIRIAAR